jgi:hypothetical protein
MNNGQLVIFLLSFINIKNIMYFLWLASSKCVSFSTYQTKFTKEKWPIKFTKSILQVVKWSTWFKWPIFLQGKMYNFSQNLLLSSHSILFFYKMKNIQISWDKASFAFIISFNSITQFLTCLRHSIALKRTKHIFSKSINILYQLLSKFLLSWVLNKILIHN